MRTRYFISIYYLSADSSEVLTETIKIVATGMRAAMHHALGRLGDFKAVTKVTCELMFDTDGAQP